jgi:hypothetical protein
MAYRKSLVQMRFRLRKELIGRLEREAKRNDRSLNDEVEQRLEESFHFKKERQRLAEEREELAEQRERLFAALMYDVRSHPDPKATRAALEPIEESKEQYMHEFVDDLFPPKGKKS